MPTSLYLGLDRDAFEPQWSEALEEWLPPKAPVMIETIIRHFSCPLYVLRYPENFEGDLGGREDKTPHPRKEIEALVTNAEPYFFGMKV